MRPFPGAATLVSVHMSELRARGLITQAVVFRTGSGCLSATADPLGNLRIGPVSIPRLTFEHQKRQFYKQ